MESYKVGLKNWPKCTIKIVRGGGGRGGGWEGVTVKAARSGVVGE